MSNSSDQPPAAEDADAAIDPQEFDHLPTRTLVSRSIFGGTLMGLANLVPGISGGTMLLAAGIYPRFIDAVAEVTRFRFRPRSLIVLACVVAAAAVAILLLAGTLKTLVIEQRWVMYSLFIGLTLGGLPVVWKLAKPASAGLVVATIAGFAFMLLLAFMQATGIVGSSGANTPLLFLGGLAGASAMILPGISGGYLLLLIGQYVPILGAIDDFKSALKLRDVSAAVEPALSVILPVGVGVLIGIVVVGNLLQWMLHHHRQATLGVLMGLLLGSTAGLWPFQRGVLPLPGDVIKGQQVTLENQADIDVDDWPTEYFRPTAIQVGGAGMLAVLGFGLTMGIARIGNDA